MKIMASVHPIIEWQEEIQRTPEELVKHLQGEVKNWNPERMLVLCWRDDRVQYLVADKERHFQNKDILWDVTGWLKIWREDQEDEV